MWGTDYNWIKVSLHYFVYEEDIGKLKLETVKAIARNASLQSRLLAKERLEDNGIWEQAVQIARENDLNIFPE